MAAHFPNGRSQPGTSRPLLAFAHGRPRRLLIGAIGRLPLGLLGLALYAGIVIMLAVLAFYRPLLQLAQRLVLGRDAANGYAPLHHAIH